MTETMIDTVGIIGSGQMGQGIAQVFAINGFSVLLYDKNRETLQKAKENIKQDCDRLIKKELIQNSPYHLNVHLINDLKDLYSCPFIIEAIPEDIDAKLSMYKDLDVLKGDTPYYLCTNTSSIPLSTLNAVLKHPERFMGMHFMNPPVLMPLIELVLSDKTDKKTLSLLCELAKTIKKEAVICKDTPGFLVNRVLIPMINEACLLVDDDIASLEDIDKSLKLGAHFPMGPLTLADFIGLDTVLSIMKIFHKEMGDKYLPATCLIEHVEKGFLGKKSKRGFFVYS